MRKSCYCGRARLDAQDCDYVVAGKPLCDPDCMKRASGDPRVSRDVPVGTSWAFREHRSLSEVGTVAHGSSNGA